MNYALLKTEQGTFLSLSGGSVMKTYAGVYPI